MAESSSLFTSEALFGKDIIQHQLLQLVMDNLPECIFWKDINSVYLGCNRKFAKIAGVGTPENIMGKTDYDLAWKADEAEFFRLCDRRVMDSNSPELGIIEPQLQADGKQAWLETNKVPLHDEQGKVIGILGTFQDITERKEAELSLNKLNEKLEQRVEERTSKLSEALQDLKAAQASLVESEKMAALGTLVAGVAHEINTPIGTSITVASTLADESELFVQAAEAGQLKRSILNHYLDIVRRCTKVINSNLSRAGDLIQSFKQVAVDQSHRELRTFNLKSYLQEVVTSLQPEVQSSGHQLSLTGNDSIFLTHDPGIFAQVFTNLVTNSVKHAYSENDIGHLQIQLECQDSQVIMKYSDDGCGIPTEHLSKVYEPFFTTARNKGGTGLGLNIVYNIVSHSLKGTIELQSQKGQGTTFTIVFPYESR